MPAGAGGGEPQADGDVGVGAGDDPGEVGLAGKAGKSSLIEGRRGAGRAGKSSLAVVGFRVVVVGETGVGATFFFGSSMPEKLSGRARGGMACFGFAVVVVVVVEVVDVVGTCAAVGAGVGLDGEVTIGARGTLEPAEWIPLGGGVGP